MRSVLIRAFGMNWIFAVVCFGISVGSTGQEIADAAAVPYINDRGRENYTKFLNLEEDRAFAVAKSGAHASSSKAPSNIVAIRRSVFQCNRIAKAPCYAYAVNRRIIYGRYVSFEQDSVDALKRLQRPGQDSFSSEADQSSVPEQTELRQDAQGYHALTPNRVPGATTISTGRLVERMQSDNRPILIDVLGDDHDTLPGAYWFTHAGTDRGSGTNTDIENRLETLLRAVAPDKSTPIVFFCLSYECWLSYNAALRAARIGYTNLFWYRGGTEAWKVAGLPTVSAVLTGVLR